MDTFSAGDPPSLVLGSSSRYRAELLGRLGVPFRQESPDVDEESFDVRFPSMSAEDFALTLARAKASALRRSGVPGFRSKTRSPSDSSTPT